MNTELIISRANELKEVKTEQEQVYIQTDRERDAVVYSMKKVIKNRCSGCSIKTTCTINTKGIHPSDNEIEDSVDLFRPIFSLNIILAIHYYKFCGYILENLEYKDEIEKIIKVIKILDERGINFSEYIPTSLLLYDEYNSKK